MRVRWAEVDRQGIVFNAHYLMYFDVAITEYYRALGYPYPQGLAQHGTDLFVKKAEVEYWQATGCGRGANNKALGYRSAWIDAFVHRIFQRFDEARKAAVLEAAARSGPSDQTGLMRLDGALMKVRKYIDDKFSNRRAASKAGALNHRSRNHEDGRAAGRAAADNITLGRRGIGSGGPKRLLGE